MRAASECQEPVDRSFAACGWIRFSHTGGGLAASTPRTIRARLGPFEQESTSPTALTASLSELPTASKSAWSIPASDSDTSYRKPSRRSIAPVNPPFTETSLKPDPSLQ